MAIINIIIIIKVTLLFIDSSFKVNIITSLSCKFKAISPATFLGTFPVTFLATLLATFLVTLLATFPGTFPATFLAIFLPD